MKKMSLIVLVVSLVSLINDCTKDEPKTTIYDEIKIQSFLTDLPEVGDTAIASFLVQVHPEFYDHSTEPPYNRIPIRFILKTKVCTYGRGIKNSPPYDTLTNTFELEDFYQPKYCEINIAPVGEEGDIYVSCYASIEVTYLNPEGDTVNNNDNIFKGKKGFKFVASLAESYFDHPSDCMVGKHAKDYLDDNDNEYNVYSRILTRLSTLMYQNPYPIAIICSTFVQDTLDTLLLSFYENTDNGYFITDSFFPNLKSS
jgi:hypothetical protein